MPHLALNNTPTKRGRGSKSKQKRRVEGVGLTEGAPGTALLHDGWGRKGKGTRERERRTGWHNYWRGGRGMAHLVLHDRRRRQHERHLHACAREQP